MDIKLTVPVINAKTISFSTLHKLHNKKITSSTACFSGLHSKINDLSMTFSAAFSCLKNQQMNFRTSHNPCGNWQLTL